MKVMNRVVNLAAGAALLFSACGQAVPATTTSVDTPTTVREEPVAASTPTEVLENEEGEDVLYLNLMWHQHQPLYYKDDTGVYTRPWVRVHATKDYYDMAATVAKYPDVHVTFNLTPVLLKQISDFVEYGATDRYWVLSEKPADDLTDEEKIFILQRFFDANTDHMIRTHPGYSRLYDLRGGASDELISAALTAFTGQDFRDLQVWFNLAWMDPDLLAADPLKDLVTKDHDFSEEDKEIIFTVTRQVMAEIIPLHKQLQEAGQIEVTTTPYAHPILPLIYDSDIAAEGNPQADLPDRYAYVQDAVANLKLANQMYQDLFGQSPRGLWPGEGAVSEDIVPLVANAGFQWMASGEQVLASSLGIGAFTRDGQDTVQEADQLYQPYLVQGDPEGPIQGDPVVMVFRDVLLSDKLGFTYSGTPAEDAAADFIQRLENIRTQLKEEGASGPHLVSVILDGENAWENYSNDGKDFLNALYQALSENENIRTVTPSEYMAKFQVETKIEHLFPGAWFSANYDTWIGEPEEKTAWNYLGETRKFLNTYETGHAEAPSEAALEEAFDAMYLAEGSDWFWWFGADQDSGDDAYFDEGFRALLAKVYTSLDQPIPAYVQAPIIPEQVAASDQTLKGISTPIVDGKAGEGEWSQAALYLAVGGAQARSDDVAAGVYLGVDRQNLYIRVDSKTEWENLQEGRIGIYIGSPRLETVSAISRLSEQRADSPYPLGFGATSLAEFDMVTGTGILFTAGNTGWEESGLIEQAALIGDILEGAIPLSFLGNIQSGDTLRIVAVISSGERDIQSLPSGGIGQLVLPDISEVQEILTINDPVGDDHGPGTYTYPTDTVFTEGSFDIITFMVGMDENDLIFRFTLAGEIANPWNGPNNFSIQTLDVYIDQDPGMGTGARQLLPGRNAALGSQDGWEYALWAESWTPQVVVPDPETLEPKEVSGIGMAITADPATSTITIRVPKEAFGEGDPTQWGYTAAVLSQDGYPSAGVWRVRDAQANAEQWRIGGAPLDSNHTRILDLAWPDGSEPTQEDLLSGYAASSAAVDTLSVDDFPQVQLVIP